MPDFETSAGIGMDQIGNSDRSIPYLSILQSKSPEVEEGKPQYLENAVPGMIINTLTKELHEARLSKGKHLDVIPVGFMKRWVEWKPRSAGGGLVKVHDTDEIMAQTRKGGERLNKDLLPNGNEVLFTHYWSVMLISSEGVGLPAILSFKSTALKHSRKWASLLSMQFGKRSDGSKYLLPMFARKWKLSTFPEAKNNETWYSPSFVEGDFVTIPEFDDAKTLHQVVREMPALPAPEERQAEEASETEVPY